MTDGGNTEPGPNRVGIPVVVVGGGRSSSRFHGDLWFPSVVLRLMIPDGVLHLFCSAGGRPVRVHSRASTLNLAYVQFGWRALCSLINPVTDQFIDPP